MIFVLDVGNTNTVLGVFKEEALIYQWRIKTDRHKTEDEYGMLIKSLFEHEGLTFSDMDGVIISTVVPPIMFALDRMAKKYFHVKPLVVGDEAVNPFLKMTYPNPSEIGADRIVNAVGAIEAYGFPLIIIDFGTATTYCYVNEKGEYVGGAIAPGINISLEALYSKAAKLPKVEIKNPGTVVGSSTIEAMQSGVYFGYVGQVDEVVRRIKDQATEPTTVIATGGLAKLIAKDSRTIDIVDSALTLKGLYYIYKKNMESR
ncbi:type III pantothenate kinase [Aquibacillus koreensis]|uniref:Type III pantothenate kinase n=1 Tax=Aquibacillus koreensis TaxID=279446 RepID=A0A9X4AJK7_9BACI|nr:type III pantothenate kinase [Aquibacillus koreensis]MCT2535297.1 type III pantothenate kinase [Aquibacillus koreensis]MDC3422362.1 type III pantothenate kinase [Aquibacillus koreensis]